MKSILKYGALGAAIACAPATAFATGGVGCTIDDKNLDFAVEALFSYSGNGPLFQIRSSLESKSPWTSKALKKIEMDGTYLKQQWFENGQLKMMFFAETKGEGVPYAFIKLVIEATKVPGDEFAYEGKYVLEIGPEVVADAESVPVKLDGSVSCSAG